MNRGKGEVRLGTTGVWMKFNQRKEEEKRLFQSVFSSSQYPNQ